MIGAAVRHATQQAAAAAIAGYTVVNDVTVRDYQFRTMEWLQGKTFERTTPVGPAGGRRRRARRASACEVDGEIDAGGRHRRPGFGTSDLVSYVSTMITLRPGDLIPTGTPGGVGHARKPPRYLTEGSTLVTRIEGLGEQRNILVDRRTGSLSDARRGRRRRPGWAVLRHPHPAGRPVDRGHRLRAEPGRRHVRVRCGVLRPRRWPGSTRPIRCCARR